MIIDINKASIEQLRAAAPKVVARAESLSSSVREARAAALYELRSDRVAALRTYRDGSIELMKWPRLSTVLAETFGGRVRSTDDGTQVNLAVAPLSLKDTKAGIKKAMKLAGFRTQGRGLFPAKDHGDTPVFYVQRNVGGNEPIMLAITLGGTAKRPALFIEG